MDVQADTASRLTDHCAVLQRIINALDRIVLHANQEARTELRVGCTGIEKRRRGMSKVSFGHEIVGLDDAVNIGPVNADRNTHKHVLWAFSDATINSEEV